MRTTLMVGLLVMALLFVGCTSSEVTKVQQPDASALSENTATPVPSLEVKTFKVGSVGETLTNGKLKITLNGVEFSDEVAPAEFSGFGTVDTKKLEDKYTTRATDGRTFAIVDVSLENVGEEADTISEITFKVKDSEGYTYNFDLIPTALLKQPVGGTLQPGDKTRGKIVFEEVPKNATGLQLVFNFGFGDMAQAKFDIGVP